jgi:hypothetical protein
MQFRAALGLRRFLAASAAAALTILACDATAAGTPAPRDFTVAVLPDTQNYVDYTHQKAAGFPFDGREMFLDQMRYVAGRLKSQGGDIAFVDGLGDVWQHQTLDMDPEHVARGFKRAANPLMDRAFAPTPQVREIEMPTAREGYALIAGKTPFAVVPGNHDHDAMWTDAAHPPKPVVKSEADIGMLHAGGLTNFVSVFGAQSDFFRDKPWYVGSHEGGADSAQIFTAGGYTFLHIGLRFDPPTSSLDWAAEMIRKHPGLPTIVTTHDYMNNAGERLPNPIIDNHAVDPNDNTPQMVWDKFLSQHDQIFLVLCGHEHGQAIRVDDNRFGHKVVQVLSDYQDRRQTAIDAGVDSPFVGIGDGWLRLMTFHMGGETPTITVKTYSTVYKQGSRDTPQYAAWYKAHEKPAMSDQQFQDQDDYSISLTDFRQRFGNGS